MAWVPSRSLTPKSSADGNWLTYSGTYRSERFLALDEINRRNVDRLKVLWAYQMQPTDISGAGLQETTPLVVDGVMYTTSAWSIVHALDARTGEPLWSYDPKVAKDKSRHACCDVVNRGVAVWQGQVFVGTLDGRLVALDAATGKPGYHRIVFTVKGGSCIVFIKKDRFSGSETAVWQATPPMPL